MTLSVALGFAAFFVAFLFFYQRRMIYFPRRYEFTERVALPPNIIEIKYSTSNGTQRAFYYTPSSGSALTATAGKNLSIEKATTTTTESTIPPRRLWVVFGGNASLALDWMDTVEACPDKTFGFLLIDYPGYGRSQGSPTRSSIVESSEAAFRALTDHFHIEPPQLETDLNILGHSLGAAAGLEFAARHPIRQLILISPFTRLIDMARRTVGWPLCHLLKDRFDNHARLAELVARKQPPRIDILHGDSDEVIPFSMGLDLARQFPGRIRFHPIHGGDHNGILTTAQALIFEIMTRSQESSDSNQTSSSRKP